jgi:hypothetical protein
VYYCIDIIRGIKIKIVWVQRKVQSVRTDFELKVLLKLYISDQTTLSARH